MTEPLRPEPLRPYPYYNGKPDPTILVTEAIDRAVEAIDKRIEAQSLRISDQVASVDKLTEAKFVTYETMLKAQAEQVGIALTASEKAIDKAEINVSEQLKALSIADGTARDNTVKLIEDVKERLALLTAEFSNYKGRAAATQTIVTIGLFLSLVAFEIFARQ